MRLQNPLAALSPTLDMGVLYVLARVTAEFTAPRIQELLPEGGSLAGVRKALVRLRDQGLVEERVAGRTHTYRLNQEHLLASAVRAMASARHTLLERIRRELEGWEFSPPAVILFGSAARGEMRTDSDIDVFIVLPEGVDEEAAEARVQSLVAGIGAWTGNDARPLLYHEDEITDAPIFDSILKDGLVVTGSSTWLRRALRRHRQNI